MKKYTIELDNDLSEIYEHSVCQGKLSIWR